MSDIYICLHLYGDESSFGPDAFVDMVITSKDNIAQVHVQ